MNIKFIILSFFIIIFKYSYSQNVILGNVYDTNNQPLSMASINIINTKDSILMNSVRSKNNGSFLIKTSLNECLLKIVYPTYKSFDTIIKFHLEDTILLNIHLITMEDELKEITVITGISDIEKRGDTIEYNAARFKVDSMASAEDLLKILPGIQVDNNSIIYSQGKRVQNLYVDGEEFFGDDPTLAAKNIYADMIDKVQVYDKKSDHTTFTGIEDGKKEKTINLKLKENKKYGKFGKVDIGLGNKKIFKSVSMINIFDNTLKFSLYEQINNLGEVGLSFKDKQQYTESYNPFEKSELDWDGTYGSIGIPFTANGGFHFSDKFIDKKLSLSTNFKTGGLNVNGTEDSEISKLMQNKTIKTKVNHDFENKIYRNNLNLSGGFKTNNFNMKLSIDASIIRKNLDSKYKSIISNEDSIINNSIRNINNNSTKNSLFLDLLLQRRFNKNKSLEIISKIYLSQQIKNEYLYNINNFKLLNVADSIVIFNFNKRDNNNSNNINTDFIYSQPFFKNISLEIKYNIDFSKYSSNMMSYDKLKNNKLDSNYSGDFSYNDLKNGVGIGFYYNKQSYKIKISNGFIVNTLTQENNFENKFFQKSYKSLNPQVDLEYRYNEEKSILFQYIGKAQMPRIEQIVPIVINVDPLNLAIGNPNLIPAFNNSFIFNFSNFKSSNERYYNILIQSNITNNNIAQSVNIDERGISRYNFMNFKQTNYDIISDFYFNKKITKNTNYFINCRYTNLAYYNNVNNIINKTKLNSLFGNIGISTKFFNIINLSSNAECNYNLLESSFQQNVSYENFLNYKISTNINFTFSKNFIFNSSFNLINQGSYFNNIPKTERYLLDISLSKKFSKKNIYISLLFHDIFNQNVGIINNNTINSIIYKKYTVIPRYFIFSFTWNFKKMNK